MSKVEFNTVEFEFSHGKTPRGFGVWMFSFKNPARRDWDVLKDPFSVTPACTYADARKEVRRVAKMFGFEGTVYVCS